ncbi:hypothetical protein IAG44_07530 [Streptomyces roseirectus]|uniref:Chorismate lyase n=1 Tax=Streptomyces roseirectus TaxID=2768066 RepID=A0A7H0I936_9ACTN|nr:hypothetical protein [Streptomyces roseirectus]QNP69302.1 hypothetical protein IAG44_07530 [Streptomyces roseirectus]
MQSPIWTDELSAEQREEDSPRFVARPLEEVTARIRRFTHPATRLLLSGDGLTTTLLRAWTGADVTVLRAAQHRVPAAETPWGAGKLLGTDGAEAIVRHSVLGGADGADLSRNAVVARPDLCPAARHCLEDTSAPLGPMLQAAGTAYRRSLLDAGRRPWGPCGQPAAYKAYLLWHGERPFAAVFELFNPAVVPADAR